MESTYRVVFKGQILPGFELASAKETAATRLKASPAQVEQLFSGRVVVLKKGVSQDMGNRYAAELAGLGLQAHVEAETRVAPELATAQASETATTVPPAPAAVAPLAAPVLSETPHVGTGEVKSFDAERTLIASADTLAKYFSASAESNKQAAAPEPTLAPVAPTPPAEKPSVEHEGMVCPACGKTQRRRGICRSCGHDMSAPPAPSDEPALLEASGALAKSWEQREGPRVGGSVDKTELADMPARRGGSDTTVFVPRRGSSDATVLAPLDNFKSGAASLADDDDAPQDDLLADNTSSRKPGNSRTLLLLLLALALAGAAAYYFLYS